MRNKAIHKSAQSAKPDFVTPTAAQPKSRTATSSATPDKKTPYIIAITTSVVIALMGAYFLIARNSDTLFMAQGQSFFTTDKTFFDECMRLPGGFIAWAASFMTQFFYHPCLGGSMMIALWIASVWISKLAFKVNAAWMPILAIPAVCILVSMIDNGYWIYYIKQTGFWYYATVGYFCTMVIVLIYSFTNKMVDSLLLTVITAFTYPFLGWYTMLALVYAALIKATKKNKSGKMAERITLTAMPVAAAIATPLLLRSFYPDLRDDQIWTSGLTFFQCDAMTSLHPQIPLLAMAFAPLAFPFLSKCGMTTKLRTCVAWSAAVIVLGLSAMWAADADFQNYNYHAEMRMYRAADECDWDKVLDEMSDLPGDASREMVMLKNIALLNKGEMGEKMYKYNNMGEQPKNDFDTLRVHMVQAGGELIYYYHGKTNFSLRWGIENSVEYGYCFYRLKNMARCALVNGEMDLAKKYLNILSTSIYYKDWAESLLPVTDNPELLKNFHEFDTVKELWSNMGSTLDGDNGLCEMYLLNYFSHTINNDDKLLAEMTLNYAMVQKDIQLFWPRFFIYAKLHNGERMPTHYQEAALLYGNLEPQNVNISNMPFDKKVKEDYAGFQQMSQSLVTAGMDNKQVGEAMKSTYGNTFFWFYFFSRNVLSY